MTREPRKPAFLSTLPATPEIDELARLFEQGNYAALRKRAKELSPAAEPRVQAGIDELVLRTRPEPLLLWIFGLSFVLLVLVTAFAYGNG